VSWLLFLFLAQSEYRGTLAPDLVAEGGTHMANMFTLATADQRKPLGDARGKIFIGKIQGAPAFLVEGESTVLYVDTGRLTEYTLRPDDDALVADVGFPLPGPAYKSYPVRVWVYREQRDPGHVVRLARDDEVVPRAGVDVAEAAAEVSPVSRRLPLRLHERDEERELPPAQHAHRAEDVFLEVELGVPRGAPHVVPAGFVRAGRAAGGAVSESGALRAAFK